MIYRIIIKLLISQNKKNLIGYQNSSTQPSP